MIVHGKHKKIVSRRAEIKKPDKLQKPCGIKEFYQKRDKILIIRAVGGLGDILMHRMMFEDFKELIGEVHFACPVKYHDAVKDHPHLDRLLDSSVLDKSEYLVSYNTTTACGRYEMKKAPLSDLHRSDIWSQHCGLTLKNHNMHLQLTEKEKEEGRKILEDNKVGDGPTVLVSPISASRAKNLLEFQLMGLVKWLVAEGYSPVGIHSTPILPLVKRKLPSIHSLSIRQWMATINAADYVISVDTSTFHCAGGLGKPLTGIFTFADGLVYGKYFDFELVQKHRSLNPCWTCGPCYNWGECTKSKEILKPCLTEITVEELIDGAKRMFKRFPENNSFEVNKNGTTYNTYESSDCN